MTLHWYQSLLQPATGQASDLCVLPWRNYLISLYRSDKNWEKLPRSYPHWPKKTEDCVWSGHFARTGVTSEENGGTSLVGNEWLGMITRTNSGCQVNLTDETPPVTPHLALHSPESQLSPLDIWRSASWVAGGKVGWVWMRTTNIVPGGEVLWVPTSNS